jgi:4-carboxymuconolactone decarboxylase
MAKPAEERFPPIPSDELTATQRLAIAEMVSGPRGAFGGPFVSMLRSPELMDRTQKLGAFIRYHGVVPQRLRELAICVIAREWRQGATWHGHAPLAEKHGVDAKTLAQLAKGEVPKALKRDERIVYDFCRALHRDHVVDDETFAKTRDALSEAGVIELTALCGYYVLISMIMNVAHAPLPPGMEDPFR